MRRTKWSSMAVLVVVGMSLLMVGRTAAKDPAQDFVALDNEMKALHDAGFFKGGKTTNDAAKIERVTFDTGTARQRRFSSRSIAIAEQSVALTNDLVAKMSDELPGVPNGDIDVKLYPDLAVYMEQAVKFNQTAPNDGVKAKVIGQAVCGWYTNPKPNSQKNWVTFNNISDPEARLRSWGYHNTWNLAGGG